MINIKRIIYFIAIVCFIVSCKSQKLTIVDNTGKLKVRSQDEVFKDILSHQLQYNTISAKGKVGLMNKELSTTFKIQKDSILQASIRPILGIEVARLDITPSRIVVIDRLNKQYAVIEMDENILERIGFNFNNVQDILTNHIFIPGKKSISLDDYKNFEYRILNNQYILDYKSINGLNYEFSADNLDRITQLVINVEKPNASIVWSYQDFVEDASKNIYPTSLVGKFKVQEKNVELKISYSKLEIDSNLSIDTNIPSGYVQKDIKEIVNGYLK